MLTNGLRRDQFSFQSKPQLPEVGARVRLTTSAIKALRRDTKSTEPRLSQQAQDALSVFKRWVNVLSSRISSRGGQPEVVARKGKNIAAINPSLLRVSG